ncbi:uncharacterized protein [Physcomitrium patens]|uniref:RING-type domain-containing protein n=1 Tax=Physcomitrium patens TaxID=3218 RepID=A0A7I4EBM5_PHYPA|nr:uncharacterized protein LOC112285421 isoform X2 [Physcomitrium patens]|eukprot:XP_024382009.1 uncharacterized protein LOC112285421 isoform X2 [Physcomitrella patens]
MDSHDLQTRLSGFYKTSRAKFSEFCSHSKKDETVEDVLITAQTVRKKSILVIGNFTGKIVPPVDCRLSQNAGLSSFATTSPSAPVWSNVNELELKNDDKIIHSRVIGKNDAVLSKTNSQSPTVANSNCGCRNQLDEGSGTKRKAAEVEPSLKRPHYGHDYDDLVRAQIPSKKVSWKDDDSLTYELPATPVIPVTDSHKASDNLESVAKDAISQKVHNSSQVVSPAINLLPSYSYQQNGSRLKEIRVDTNVGNIYDKRLSKLPSPETCDVADDCDNEGCTTSGRRQKKDVELGGKWSLPVDVQGGVFSCKLKEILSKPLDLKEFSEMWELATRRKPLLKLRQMRGRTMHVPTDGEGLSYLDHHPDLARRLKECLDISEKMILLRGFFFWLQHSCMEGAYKPWDQDTEIKTQEGDCVFTDGPDCEVLAVVLPLDEKKHVSSVLKPLDPVIVDLSDDDEDGYLGVSVKSPEKAFSKTNVQMINPQAVASCFCCFKEFGVEKERQRALYNKCGHIDTCMHCADKFWQDSKHDCPMCGVIQSMKPKSVLDFADSF